MIRSLNTASRAMQLEQVRIDALANNLANASASGFRQVITRLAEPGTGPGAALPAETTPGATAAGGAAATGRAAAGGATEPRWTRATRADLTHALDARPGPIKPSGRDTDVAIMGRGFFEIQTADGPRYTRNGSFLLDAERRLTTPDGKPVAGDGGALTLEGDEFTIAADGTVTVDGQAVGRLKLVDFADPTRLEHAGDALLKAPEDMAAQPVPIEDTILAQGHIEGSNVNPVDTLVAMIEAQRAFEIQSKVLQAEDELLNKSVNNLPRTSA
ncbi:MAG: flagellar hook-basal body protein [bacterium]|nr:flagellar hook-basal body protein [bacterium]